LDTLGKLFDEQPVPFSDKLHALAYINSNCKPLSGRGSIMRRLMKLGARNAGGKVGLRRQLLRLAHCLAGRCRRQLWSPYGTKMAQVAVHSFGHCETNMERLPRDEGAKVDVIRK
jgi:hypothetical protein